MLSHTSDRKKLSLLRRSTLLLLAWLDFRAKLSCQIGILLCDQSGHSSSHLNIYTKKTLYTWFLYQVAVDVGPFQCRFSICGLKKRGTENQPAPTGVLFSFFKWSTFAFLPLWNSFRLNTCFQERNLRWLPANKMDVFHHCFHKFFFQSWRLFSQPCLQN